MFRLRRPTLPLRLQTLEDRVVPAARWDLPHSSTEIIARLQSTDALFDLTGYAVSRRMTGIDMAKTRLLLQDTSTGLVTVKLSGGADPQTVANLLEECAGVKSVHPNYIYSAQQVGIELTPDDPYYTGAKSPQAYHINKLKLDGPTGAWELTTGKPSIVIAVLDEGVSFSGQFVDLPQETSLWINDDNDNNGIDDDGNGFIDDRYGWDFADNDANPGPNSPYWHGNYVAGLIAARTNNGEGIAGVTGGDGNEGTGVRIMPVRVYPGSGNLDSVKLASALYYAADNGAKIINMSLKSDAFATDPSVVAALDYAYDTKKALIFFSAGNNNEAEPARGVLTHPLFVAGTDGTDKRWTGSNYGAFVDIAAPAVDIVSLNNPNVSAQRYVAETGTSASAPLAAGVAALIWSKHPTYTRDQVAAKLLNTADNIDGLNAGFEGKLGTGRANALRALTETLPPPKLGAITGLPAEGATTTSLTTMMVATPSRLDSTRIIDQSVELRSDGSDGVFDTADDILVSLSVSGYRMGSPNFSVSLAQTITSDRYRFTIKSGNPGLADPFGVALDGNGDGSPGDSFQRTFFINNGATTKVTSVETNSGQIVTEGGSLFANINELKVSFSQGLSSVGGAIGPSSATNPSNWQLIRDGQDVSNRIVTVTVGAEAVLGTGTAMLSLDGALQSGKYTLIAKDSVSDSLGNAIDGDGNGLAGGSFVRQFTTTIQSGEFIVGNAPLGAYDATPTSAINDSGRFVVTWTETSTVKARVFDEAGFPATTEFSLGLGTYYPVSGMAANGDFVLAWRNTASDDIVARRYFADGTPKAGQFTVNVATAGLQDNTAIAVNEDGSFVISWHSPDGNGDGVFARVFDKSGKAITSDVLVNQVTLGNQLFPSVAMDDDGDFVIAYQHSADEECFARRFSVNGTPMGDEFRIHAPDPMRQAWPSVAMAGDGRFVIGYYSASYLTGWDVVAQRFASDGSFVGAPIPVNEFTPNNQYNPRVAIDDNGDFTVVWESNGQDANSTSSRMRRFTSAGVPLTGESQLHVNEIGAQRSPNIAMSGDGESVAVWWDGSVTDIIGRRFVGANLPPTTTGIPNASILEGGQHEVDLHAVFQDNEDPDSLLQFSIVANSNSSMVLASINPSTDQLSLIPYPDLFGSTNITIRCTDSGGTFIDETFTLTVIPVNDAPSFVNGPDIIVPSNGVPQSYANWASLLSIGPPNESIQALSFEFAPLSAAQTALFAVLPAISPTGTLTLDTADGNYGAAVIKVRAKDSGGIDNGGIDVSPWQWLTITVTPGFDHTPLLGGARVNDYTFGVQNQPSVASDALGNYVVVWSSAGEIYMQRYASDRQSIGADTLVNANSAGSQALPQVAMNAAGAFVVTWAGEGEGDVDGIFAQAFLADGAVNGAAIRINATTTGVQTNPQVGIDATGNFTIAWEGPGGVFYRRHKADGVPLDGNDVSVAAAGSEPALAVDYEGDFVIAWTEANDIRASFFTAAGVLSINNKLVNTFATGNQIRPAVAVDADGDAVIAWQSQNQVAGGGWDLYRQMFSRTGAALGSELAINTTTTGDQTNVRIALDADSDLVAVWQAPGPNGLDLFQRFYDYQGLALQNKDARVNRVTTGDQKAPAVATDADGDFIIAWEGRGSVDLDGQVAVQRNTFFLPEGLPNVVVDGGTIETLVPLFDYYIDDWNFAESSDPSLYTVTDVSTVALFDTNNNGKAAGDEVSINKTTGVLSVNYRDRRHGNSNITVRVRDTTELPLDVTFSVGVRPLVDPINPPSLMAGQLWTWMTTGSEPAEAGHVNGYSLIGAPAGMTIDAKTGQIQWTPNAAGKVSFTVRVTDFNGQTPTTLSGDRAVTLTVDAGAPKVQSVKVNDGLSDQRSRVEYITVAFDSKVNFAGSASDAFEFLRTGPGTPMGAVQIAGVDTSASTSAQTIAKIIFTGGITEFGSLIDGNYSLRLLASKISTGGLALDGNGDGTPGDDYTGFTFHRLFGDADGNRSLTAGDFNAFRLVYGTSGTSIFDFNNDGQVSAADFNEFRLRYGVTLTP